MDFTSRLPHRHSKMSSKRGDRRIEKEVFQSVHLLLKDGKVYHDKRHVVINEI